MSISGQRIPVRSSALADSKSIVLRLRLIGHMRACTPSNRSVLPAGRKTRALLAVIALSAPRPALRGRLAELLWSSRPEEQARASLRQEIHRLLEAVTVADNDILVVTRDHISLRPGAVWIDVAEVMQATTSDPAGLALLDSDLLEDLDGVAPAFDAWLTTERERLRDRARTIAEVVLREQSIPDAVIKAAQRLLSIDRAHEGAWRALMRAHADRGERGLAIQAYDRCHAALTDLLDARPSHETDALLADIRGPVGSRPPARPSTSPVHLVPRSATATETQTTPAPGPAAFEPAAWTEPPRPAPVATKIRQDREDRVEPEVAREGASVGVLPLQRLGAGAGEAPLASGLADELTTALSRFHPLRVVASSALARFALENRDEAAIRQAFGIDYLLAGSVQQAGEQLRITLHLVDLRAGNEVVWAQRFDRQAGDPLRVQEKVASEAVAQIDAQIMRIEGRRCTRRPLAGAGVSDLVLRALPLMSRMERTPFAEAGSLLARAVGMAPDASAAHAWHAYWHALLVAQDWADDPAAMRLRASKLAERAILLNPFDARALAIAGHVRGTLCGRLGDAAALQARAVSLNPNLAMAWALSAETFAYMGDTEEAERRSDHYRMLSPLDPCALLFDSLFTLLHLLKRDHESAAATGRVHTQVAPFVGMGFKPYLSALGHLGRIGEANEARQQLLALEPGFTVERFMAASPLARDADRAHVAEGLQLAGLP